MDNVSVLTFFVLSGLNYTVQHRIIIFALTLLCYSVIWIVNAALIITIIVDRKLHEPMHVFLCNLCINGLYGTAGFYPKFLMDLLSTTHVISYAGCLLQGFVLHSSACADLSFLAVMAYDRYVAICRPLVYHSVMTKQKVCVFVFFAWLVPIYLVFMGSVTTSRSRLCGSHIPRIYCINWLIGRLACSASIANVAIPAFNYTFYSGHFVFIIWSYVYLIRTCLTSRENMTKFIQTCLPHLFCLLIFIVCLLFDLLYMRFGSKDLPQSAQNFMAIVFLLIPPLFNPLIYGFKLTQIRNRIMEFLCGKHL
ncbi:olfactory receptor 52D1-like [Epinephelus fuscoguttatus]|uniref:olfactory receptor 52D1-like n=1 Tax=Epinephelus fuscoguttatus TaxID=293821 RepID=UPI0020D0F35C|nr:olfactory receptor 52D1-like [Epinephelus fuscoguttatus]